MLKSIKIFILLIYRRLQIGRKRRDASLRRTTSGAPAPLGFHLATEPHRGERSAAPSEGHNAADTPLRRTTEPHRGGRFAAPKRRQQRGGRCAALSGRGYCRRVWIWGRRGVEGWLLIVWRLGVCWGRMSADWEAIRA